jgi:hypothetical protein
MIDMKVDVVKGRNGTEIFRDFARFQQRPGGFYIGLHCFPPILDGVDSLRQGNFRIAAFCN